MQTLLLILLNFEKYLYQISKKYQSNIKKIKKLKISKKNYESEKYYFNI